MFKKQIFDALVVASKPLKIPPEVVEITPSSNEKFGDFSSNVALQQSKFDEGRAKQTPLEIANKIVEKLPPLGFVDEVTVTPPGFINFSLKKGALQKEVSQMLKEKGVNLALNKKKIMVEFTDPNPFKEFHIGHLYSNAVGEALCRLLEATGATVKRVNYQGDVGVHIAKAIWGMRKLLAKRHKDLKAVGLEPPEARATFLGEAYALGAKEYDLDEAAKREIISLNKEIYEHPDGIEEYVKGKKWSLEYFEEIYKRLGTTFAFYYFESEGGKIGMELVKEYQKKGVFVESDGAIIFPGEKYGLHNRVFINSQGLPTYEAKELGLAPKKYQDFAYDLSIIVTGNEINEYFKVLIGVLKKVRPELGEKTMHISHGMVRFAGGKLSSRLGNALSARVLLFEIKKRINQEFNDIDSQTAEKVAVGAVKYALLKGSIGKDIQFSLEESISLDGNSGPYLQYTFARCLSVLAKGNLGDSVSFDDAGEPEILLLRALGKFKEVVAGSASSFSPNTLAKYLFDLAQRFNRIYNELPILKAPPPDRDRRLFLTRATADVLKKGLDLLGISAPEKM